MTGKRKVMRGGGTTRTSTSGPAYERRCESRRASAEPDAGGTALRGASPLLVGRERDEQLDSCVVRAPWVPWMPHVPAVAAMPPITGVRMWLPSTRVDM